MTHATATDPPPVACSLSASDHRRRLEDTEDLARDSLLARQRIEGGARLTFAGGVAVRDRLEGFVAAESRCCAFLTLDLDDGGDDLVLTVTGPAEAEPIIEALFARA